MQAWKVGLPRIVRGSPFFLGAAPSRKAGVNPLLFLHRVMLVTRDTACNALQLPKACRWQAVRAQVGPGATDIRW